MPKVTVFTPTYNRARTLSRVFNSLVSQKNKDFERIIVDDGSTDNTRDVIANFIKTADFPIFYFYQLNSGKHRAVNFGVSKANGELFLIADSDDIFTPNTIEVFISERTSIDEKIRNEYKGITVRCFNADSDEEIGKFPKYRFDSNDLDSSFVHKFCFEKWNIVRTDVMREFPFPEPQEHLKFYPESIIWWRMATKYKTRYLDIALRGYYHDQENSLIRKGNSKALETRYLWIAYCNEIEHYFWKSPKDFIKAYVGFTRDILLSQLNFRDEIKKINKIKNRFLIRILYPLGYFLYLKRRG